jgi:2-polyprenyl-3-methyl-5-hydroxy-6-metoxy-1,4-benzoquinol methylase
MPELIQKPSELRRIRVRAEREIAYASPDHLAPWGTRRDNSRQRRFNQKLYRLFGEERPPLWVLDLGCSGGGFVKDCLDDGCMAVGIEGSDFSKRTRRAEWRSIPEHLFTADITAPFEIIGEFPEGERKLGFDVITTWEVMEHIHERDLGAVVENVKKHLRPGGLWIMSIALCDDIHNGTNLHQTVKPKAWWIDKLQGLGVHCVTAYVEYFNTQFLRGPKDTCRPGFHLVATNDPKHTPTIPPESLPVRLYDKWLGSRPQRLLKLAIYGV